MWMRPVGRVEATTGRWERVEESTRSLSFKQHRGELG